MHSHYNFLWTNKNKNLYASHFQNERNGVGNALAVVSGAALAVKLYMEQDNR